MMNRKTFLRRWLDKIFVEEGFPLARFVIGALVCWALVSVLLRVWVNGLIPTEIDPNAGSWNEAFWRAMIETFDLAGLGKEELSNWPNRWVGLITALVGGLILLSGVAGLSAKLTVKRLNWQSGLGDLGCCGHSLVLGFAEQGIDVIEELIEANRYNKKAEIVVLSDLEPAEALERLKEGISSFENTRIHCRKGNISSPITLSRVGVDRARTVVLVNPVQPWENEELKHEGDTAMQMAVMAIQASCPKNPPPVVVRMHFKRNLQVAQSILPGRVFAAQEDLMMAKIIAQTARNPDVGRVYSNLAGFRGNEFYFLKMPSQLVGLSFMDAAMYFTDAMPLGIRYSDGTMGLNPPVEQSLQATEDLILLALDASHLRCLDSPCIAARPLSISERRGGNKREHYLIYGWNRKAQSVITEFATYLAQGSVVNIVVPEVTETIERQFKVLLKQHDNLQLGLGQVNPGEESFPAKLNPERYRAVLLLSLQGRGAEAMDRITFSLLLKFRAYFGDRLAETGKTSRTKLLAEIQRTKNGRLMQATGVNSFLISSQILSKILAQVADEPSVLAIYDDLFQANGNEIYFKDLSLYLDELDVEVHFADLVLAAQRRGEVCLGIKLKRLGDGPEDNFGLVMLPTKSQSFWVAPGDQLITLAPDQT